MIRRKKNGRGKLVKRKIGREENWSSGKLVERKVGREESWSSGRFVERKFGRRKNGRQKTGRKNAENWRMTVSNDSFEGKVVEKKNEIFHSHSHSLFLDLGILYVLPKSLSLKLSQQKGK